MYFTSSSTSAMVNTFPGAVMHMPVNKPNVNCTYDSSHGTDEIYPKGPPHIYIYTHYVYIHIKLELFHLNVLYGV